MRTQMETTRMNGSLSRMAACLVVLSMCVLFCGVEEASAIPDFEAQCDTETGECCTNWPPEVYCNWIGVGQGEHTQCYGEEACCMADGSCMSDVDGICCDDVGGTSTGAGTVCLGNQACCMSDSSCEYINLACCELEGGIPAGPGTNCNDPAATCGARVCCLPGPGTYNDYCDNTNFYNCVTGYGDPHSPGSPWCEELVDTDDDLVPDICDNCPLAPNGVYDGTCVAGGTGDCEEDSDCDTGPGSGDGECSMNQTDGDYDERGDPCDNCPEDSNYDQDDADSDGVGDECDNCVNVPNGPDLGTCMGGDVGEECYDDAECDTSPGQGDGVCSLDQEDCDSDEQGDVCALDCDGDGTPDNCDSDIDGDDIDNDEDRCDYSPSDLVVVDDDTSPFYGTHRADLDGDCDVDDDDDGILDAAKSSASCVDGDDEEDALCPACPACNSCCFKSM